jgi:hypothetical protein
MLKIFAEKKLLINNGLLTEKKAKRRPIAAMWVNAAGYYGQKGDNGMMVLFISIFCLAVGAICIHYQLIKKQPQTCATIL